MYLDIWEIPMTGIPLKCGGFESGTGIAICQYFPGHILLTLSIWYKLSQNLPPVPTSIFILVQHWHHYKLPVHSLLPAYIWPVHGLHLSAAAALMVISYGMGTKIPRVPMPGKLENIW